MNWMCPEKCESSGNSLFTAAAVSPASRCYNRGTFDDVTGSVANVSGPSRVETQGSWRGYPNQTVPYWPVPYHQWKQGLMEQSTSVDPTCNDSCKSSNIDNCTLMAIQLSRRACITNSQWYSEQAQSVILKGLGSRCNIIDQKYQLAWIRTQRPAQTKTACRFEKSFLVFTKLYLKTSHTTTVYSKRNSSQCSSHCSTVIFFLEKY